MKKLGTILCIFQLLTLSIYSQKHDNVWLTGINTSLIGNFLDSRIEFDTFPPEVYLDEDRYLRISQCGTSISNEYGNLLFYTNCNEVVNAENQQMENGDSLNFINYYTPTYKYGSFFHQGVICLPDPSDSQSYYLLHISPELSYFQQPTGTVQYGTHVLYSKIDMTKNNGLGAVIEKNIPVVTDTLMVEGLTAVRHSNGRDWWLLVFEFRSKRLYRILVSDQGVQLDGTQVIDTPIHNLFGQNVFTPDGSKFIVTPRNFDTQNRYWVEIFDFDRCTGLLSNRKRVYYSKRVLLNPSNNTWLDDHAWGCSVSPNSRYLYLSLFYRVIQIDLQAANSQNAVKTIADYDGFEDDWHPDLAHAWFGISQLAPDGRIFINTAQPTDIFHVIERPNNLGLSAFIHQHSFQLPGINAYAMPNHPNYRLQPSEGSGCDTLGIEKAVFIHAHPYPATGCLGGTAWFEVTAFGTGMSYQWQSSSDGGVTWANLNNDINFSGVQSVYLTLKDIPASFHGRQFRCIVSGNVSTEISRPATLEVIGAKPVAAFDFTQDKDSLHFQNLATGEDYYTWFFGDGDSILLENPSHLYRKAGSYTATLVAANACGQDTFTQEIIIPKLQAAFTSDKIYGCAPLTVKFASQSSYRVSNHRYFFQGGSPASAWSSSGFTATTYNTPGVYDVTLIVYTPGNAELDTLVLEDYITVLAGVNPVANIDATQSGDTVHLNTTFGFGDSYTWFFSNGDTFSGQSVSYVFGTPGVYEVVLEVSNLCGAAFDTMQFVVGNFAASFSSNKTSGCAPLKINFQNTMQFSPDSVKWHFPGGHPAFSNDMNPGVVYQSPGIWDVTMIVYAGGLTDTLHQQAYIEVFEDDCPGASISIQQNNLELTAWTNCQNGTGYTWNMGDGSVLHTQAVNYQYDTTGTYLVQLIVDGLCGADSAKMEVKMESPLSTGGTVEPATQFIIQPNPVKGVLEIDTERPVISPVTFQLYDAIGKSILVMQREGWFQKEQLNVHHIPAGFYFYEIKSQDRLLQSGKIVKVE